MLMKCGGTTIEYGDCEPEGDFIYKHHTCECGCNWDERYDMTIVCVEKG